VDADLPNFQEVSPNLFRGGQPTFEGIARLKQLGVRTIINLRDPDEITREEEREARDAGMQYFEVPMPSFFQPTNASMRRVLALLDDQANRPVYLHCRRGCDRTGAVVACYRIASEGWTAERAIAEATDHGMSGFEYLKRVFIRGFADRARRALARRISRERDSEPAE
jgi:uncharacterized protein (TIGR01244 family)